MTVTTDPIDVLAEVGLLPVVTIADADVAPKVASALVAGGLAAVEITLRTPAALDAIRRVVADVPDAVVGAGSVLTSSHALAAIDAGARFVVSPGFDDGVLETAASHGTRAIPGIATATELQRAANSGVDVVKVFPAELAGGPDLIDALAAVWPTVRFVPTGGITLASAPAYLQRPSVLAVGGSWMVSDADVRTGNWSGVETVAAEAARVARRTP